MVQKKRSFLRRYVIDFWSVYWMIFELSFVFFLCLEDREGKEKCDLSD